MDVIVEEKQLFTSVQKLLFFLPSISVSAYLGEYW